MTDDERCFLFLLARMVIRPRPPDHIIRAAIARMEAAATERQDAVISKAIGRMTDNA